MTRKRIAVNTRLLLKDKLEGIGCYTHETMRRIVENHPEIDFYFFFDRKYSKEFIYSKNVIPIVLIPQARHPILFDIWFDYSIKKALKKYKIDVFLSPDGILCRKTKTPQVTVIHDLNFEHYPEDLPSEVSKYYKKRFPRFAQIAKKIITVSESSKDDICKLYDIEESKVEVIYNGVNTNYTSRTQVQNNVTKDKYTNGCDYFVYVGSMHPRKNIKRLLLAFDDFKKRSQSNLKLVLIGKAMWSNNQTQKDFENLVHKNDVIFTGRLYNSELNDLLSGSQALCYVPYFEGFGLPILEGFICETAVITSSISSMPEVAGNAALLVDPFDVKSITDGMFKIYDDQDFRAKLIEKGKKRLDDFSWDKSADQLWKVLNTILDA